MIKGIAKYDLLKSVAHYCALLFLCIIALIHKDYNQTVVFVDGVRTIDQQSVVLAAVACPRFSTNIPLSHIIALAEPSASSKSVCRPVGPFFEFLVLSS